MEAEIRSWLEAHGFPEWTALDPMTPGLGSTSLWSFVPEPGADRLVLRLFGPGADHVAHREDLAMTAAAGAGIPVPAVHARGEIAGRPLLVTSFLPGVPASDAFLAHPESAAALGQAIGDTLGRIGAIVAPEDLAAPGRHWLEIDAPALDPLRDRLAALPDQDRLLHLDYHPLNVLVADGRVTGVIDWENARSGPPHLDLARTCAILRGFAGVLPLTAAQREGLAAFEEALVDAHAAVLGPDPRPDLSAAWALAMTVADLEAQHARPGSPISRDLVAALTAERDAAIAAALA